MLKNFKLGTKLMGGFALAALLILTVGILSIWQQERMRSDLQFIAEQTSEALQDCLVMDKTLYAGFAEVNTLLSPYLTAADRRTVLKQLNEIRDERMKTQERFLGKSVAKQVENEWKAYLQTSAASIKSNNQIISYSNELLESEILNPYQMMHDLDTFEIELRTGRAKTADLVQKRIPFEGGTDDQTTQLGKWLANVDTSNPVIKAAAETIRPLHKQFYQGIARIKDLVAQGDYTQAAQILDNQLKPLMQEMNRALATAKVPLFKAMESLQNMSRLQLSEGHDNLQALSKAAGALVDKMNDIADGTAANAVKSAGTSKMINTICMIAGVILALAMGFLLTRVITKPLFLGVNLAKAMSEGDLTQNLAVDQRDEIGILAKALNNMAGSLRKMFGDIHSGVGNVDNSSSQLAAISLQMSTSLTSTAKRSEQVASAAEEMSSNQNTIAAAMEQASINVNMVATSAEEMNATITEIASNSAMAKKITAEAVNHSQKASERVDELGRAADDINKVTEVITEISEQTNLLALNATIEAARAGEVGRGFAVVANEIKDLAKQTAEATLDIKNKIQGIQSATNVTVKEINEISSVIVDIDSIVATIASAVEEQSVTTKEIAENVAQASQGITEVNENVAQSSIAAQEIAKDIAEVSQSANELSDASNQVKINAEELKRVSDNLKIMVNQFKI